MRLSCLLGLVTLQDISAENADQLHALCQTVVDEGPKVFVPLPEAKQNKRFQEEVPVYVLKWTTFQELMLVLQASLQDIVDRWVFQILLLSCMGAGKRAEYHHRIVWSMFSSPLTKESHILVFELCTVDFFISCL